jgi:hypothetical protein
MNDILCYPMLSWEKWLIDINGRIIVEASHLKGRPGSEMRRAVPNHKMLSCLL